MFKANNKIELFSTLSGIDISVPRRTEGRTKDHTERSAISQLFGSLAGANQLTFPIKVSQRERPDFLLVSGTMQIGIEHTEAVPQNDAHKTVLREKDEGPSVHFIAHHRPGEPKKTAKQLKKEIKENRAGDGWEGDSVEREWAEAMFHFIKDKIITFSKVGFEKFDKNWLLIYDNWCLPALDREIAVQYLSKIITENNCNEKFDHIYIITGKLLCEFSTTGTTQYETNNLWN